ncbi:MAG: sigma-54-dependent Fis family transcriptional regulator [Bdellovibrionaceae bacterium]|nr:sigma-54-dependent Fis family transcriptional regulator [Pseudobdellovibrionaceae bacterium]
MSVKILIIDDESAIREVLSASLKDDGYEVEVARDGLRGLDQISQFQPDIVLLDIWMPGEIDGLEVLKRAKSKSSKTQFIIMSGHGTIETAVKATKLEAWDFVEKPLSMDKISILIKNILNFQSEQREKQSLLNRLRKNIALIGESEEMVTLKKLIARVAPTNSWVLITGDNGTGKELVAQNIHYLSRRASKAFVDVNCAAIPKDLIESELFGYEKGAFTGADRTKRGKFDLANGGTLFLDEIGDMSLEAQAKVLRILQEQSFTRVGGVESIKVDVRVIAATNKDLKLEIENGNFREDLYYRLNVIPFKVPSLKDRIGDITALVKHFSEQFSRESGFREKLISDEAYSVMTNYSWPGNVRELKNFIERLYILTPSDFIDVHDLKFAGLSLETDSVLGMTNVDFREARALFEKEFILQKITENNGNISKTAESIGLERSYLHRKIKTFGIEI